MTFQKKNADVSAPAAEGPKVPRGYVDGKKYFTALATVKTLSEQLEGIQKSLTESATEVVGIEEQRRQEGATFAFDLKLKRDAQLAVFAKEDEDRRDAFSKRDAALLTAEDVFTELLGVGVTVNDHAATGKAIRVSYETALKAAAAAGETTGKAAAAASYNIAKKVDDANAATKLALLEQQNTQLTLRNGQLEAQVKQLLDAQAKVNETVADVAKQGLQAAAGVVAQGNNALGTAAGGSFAGRTAGR